MTTLDAVVGRLRFASTRASALRFALHALFAATAWVLAVLVAGRMVPLELEIRIAAFGVPVAFAAVGVAWIVARPRPMQLMRTADFRLGLKERLSTAYERRSETGPLDGALRRDALEHAARAKLAAAYPLGVRRGELLLTAAIAVAAIGLVLLPNPMDQVLSQRRADRNAQSQAAATIGAVQKKLAAASSPAPVDQKVQAILQDTKAKISEAPNPRSGLQNITPAEQQLLQLSDPETPARASSAQNLANNLSATTAGRSASQAISTSPSKGAQALRDLANQLQNLSPEQKAQLAQALANAAQQSKDAQMAASLQQASSALSKNDEGAAAVALNDVAGQLDSLQQQMNNDQEIAAAINGLEASRQQLAAQADRDAAAQSGASASATGSGSGNAQASSSSSGSGSGNANGNGNGNGNGSGNGNGNGNGTGSGNGTGGTGGVGNGGGSVGAGQGAAATERVYVPAPPVPGETGNEPAPLGPGQDVPLTPYSQVIQAYEQSALDAANQSLIPGSERDLIRQYFASLGETPTGK